MPDQEHPDAGTMASLRSSFSSSDRAIARRLIRPLQSFLDAEASGAILLLVAAVLALVWINSPVGDTYERFWATEASLDIGGFHLTETLQLWVNDGLMTLFFFVVGLEIKREVTTGELRDARSVAMPAIAALGGMLVPVAIYAVMNAGGAGSRGWGIPAATDIAFAVGVLTIAAKSAPRSVRPFLLTLAIVDDIGAILLIAIFYSKGISLNALALAGGLIILMVVADRLHIRAMPVYVVLGIAVWIATFESGIHPTIAGVVLGLLAPARPFQPSAGVSGEAQRVADLTDDDPDDPDDNAPAWLYLSRISREAVSPLARAESVLHPWTSFVIVPIFALANAGIELSRDVISAGLTSAVTLGVALGLVVGKTVGISVASWVAVRTKLGRLPAGATWGHIVGVAALGGIGFTVSLFIAELAFRGDQEQLDAAKLGILFASVLAGVIGYLILRVAGPAGSEEPPEDQ